ncbi:paraquat-inducible protein A [Commensalibacter communis]|uniref:paraquat-inducible protein A n=1 Tax=Commensalibacter communis TaxID=2972786 RepID=UPI0022FF957E|nr:PqiA/YebS family transporter subunit [Commensalibacter communis]CAI3922231.1 Intermembrane transporter PqiABC subunit PqiA (PqiA) (PUBMED:27795327) [Commensalibacter communis]CAI3932936.1 Intermembrane transporter PqiABC subunit PqiA (PqiA) (PUBMED:27795327) [Commensalibacter communis]
MLESKKLNEAICIVDQVVECHSCGLVQQYPEVNHGELVACHRCGLELFRHPLSRQWAVPFAFAISSVILYLMMVSFPLLSVNIYGRTNSLGILNGSIEFMHQSLGSVGALVGLVVVVFPIVIIGLILSILYYSRFTILPSFFPRLLHLYRLLRPWSMIEVYILGVFVAYTKLVGMAYVQIDYSLYAMVLLMISMSITDASTDFATLWERCAINKTMVYRHKQVEVGHYHSDILPENDYLASCECCGLVFKTDTSIHEDEHIGTCPRCGKNIHKRKPNSLNRSLALLITAFVFYIPANLYPIMSTTMMGRVSSHQIFGGVVELWQSQMIPLALLVFVASIAVPVLKISGIGLMIAASIMRSKKWLVMRSKLFRVITFIGRWSMIDVFMISILIALIHFDALATVHAHVGILMFAAVVVVTIFAADTFDPRLMWDYAKMNDSQTGQTKADNN